MESKANLRHGGLMRRTGFRQPTGSRPGDLADLSPLEQLGAGRLPLRVTQLLAGLTLYGISMGLFVRSQLGLDPWDVLHAGLQTRLGWSFGTVVIVVGFAVLLLWIPLRQWPGLGTIANAIVIGLATDLTLSLVGPPGQPWAQWALLLVGLLLNGLAGALYIGSQLGPGPRDGLMTGLARRTGLSLRLVRTSLEVAVLGVGWALGGIVGVGTIMYALAIGPLVQFFLPLVTVRLDARGAPGSVHYTVSPDLPAAEGA